MKTSKMPIVAAADPNEEARKKEIQGLKISFDAQLKDKQAKIDQLDNRLSECTTSNA